MLKSRTRRRIAVKTAAVATVGAGIFGAFPALASMYAAPKPVAYTCDPMGAQGSGIALTFQMDLTGPTEAVTKSPLTATWKIGPPTGATFAAPAAIPTTDRLVIEADVQIDSVPSAVPAVPSQVAMITVTAPAAAITAGQVLTPPPLTVTVTPTATGVVAFQPSSFDLILRTATGTGTDADLFSCTVADPAQATAAALKVTVKTTLGGTASPSASPSPSASASPSPSASASPSPSATPSRSASVKPTVTVYETKTSGGQIEETPEGAASTGGGGDAGPDARMIMFAGALMVALAGTGGLALRRRTTGRG